MSAINDLDTATGHRYFNNHSSLAVQFDLLGYRLIKTDPGMGGHSAYYVVQVTGGVQPLADLEAVRGYLIHLAGGCHGEG